MEQSQHITFNEEKIMHIISHEANREGVFTWQIIFDDYYSGFTF